MADLGHTPKRYTCDDGVRGNPIDYRAGWWAPGIFLGPAEPAAFGHICTACGCFYVPTDGAVCSNRVMGILKEKLL